MKIKVFYVVRIFIEQLRGCVNERRRLMVGVDWLGVRNYPFELSFPQTVVF
jgi:hypothetical protein